MRPPTTYVNCALAWLLVLVQAHPAAADDGRGPAEETAMTQPDLSGIPGPTDVLLAGGARIPAIDITNKGTLLAFCERRWSAGDASPHDIHLRRSTDGGRTWGETIAITTDGREKRKNYVNCSPVVDRQTGTIWAFYTWREHKPERLTTYFKSSTDDGITWSEASVLKTSDGAPFSGFSGVSRGIQLASGRMLLPFSSVAEGRSPIGLLSDDHGKTWRFGTKIAGNWNCIESSLVELADGTVHLNMRNSSRAVCRNVALSRDGGLTWGKPVPRPEFSQPQVNGNGCHSCVVRLSDDKHHDRNRLLYSGPPGNRRENLTVQISYDEGNTWQPLKVVKQGPSAYSNLVVLPDGTIACVYDAEIPRSGWQVRFARFTLEWLTDGKDAVGFQDKPAAAARSGGGQ